MLPLPVAPRQEHDDVLTRRRDLKGPCHRRRLAALGVGVGAVLLAAVAQGAPNPLWPPMAAPPATEVPLERLADSAYWPSDPAYAYENRSGSGVSESPGQWWLYSFVPNRATDAFVLRQSNLLPAGLSVDAAWRYTQGAPEVLLAFLDDGIDLTSPDLVAGLYLNVGELKHRPPTHSDGTACAPLDKALVDSPLMDCSEPPDGVLTIADYREALGWLPGVTGTDPNGNGILDPQDLLLLKCADSSPLCFSDDLDNDGNGLIDDLAGWDFVDFDNSPFPTYSSSGTEAALDATARANNDVDRAGVCPNCRALPVRVGHQRDASAPATALGLLYASSLGATAALIGHLPQGRSQILDAAIGTAARRNLLTLLVHDGEQQSTLAQHFNSDAVRVVGSLTQLSYGSTTSTTTTASFVAHDPCQTFEPGPTLFAAAPACSRRGPAIALGIAGLVASAARLNASATRPTAFELGAILAHSTDSIAPGWYTENAHPPAVNTPLQRLNANQAVTEVMQGLVPPELELERPLWHETIVFDSQSLPQLPVIGRISATRGSTYEVVVELAEGRNPADSDFEVLSNPTKLPSETPLASGSVLANLDLRTWSHSPSSETSRATGLIATLRVRVISQSTNQDASASVATEVRREIVIVNDKSLLPGFPFATDSMPTAPRIVSPDGDHAARIVIGTSDGRLLALSQEDGIIQDSLENPIRTDLLPAFRRLLEAAHPAQPPLFADAPPVSAELGREPITGPVAVADLTGDGNPEFILSGSTGRIYVFDNRGLRVAGWPRCITSTSSDLVECSTHGADNAPQAAPPVLVDIDGDHRNEIVVAARDGKVHAFEANGAPVDGWPVQLVTPAGSPARLSSDSPAVGDMDGDDIPDLVLSISEPRDPKAPYATWYVTILGAAAPKRPSLAAGWPVATNSYDFLVDRQNRQSPPPAIDMSGPVARALLYGNANANPKDENNPNADTTGPFFLPVDPGTTSPTTGLPRHAEPVQDQNGTQGFSRSATGADSAVADHHGIDPLFARPVLGDLDRDGVADLVLPAATVGTTSSLRNTDIEKTEHRSLLSFWNGATGSMLSASPIALGDLVGAVAPIIADLTNDGYPEIITPDGAGALVAFDFCGRSPEGWPKILGGTMSRSPSVGDTDGDGLLEVVAVTDDGRVFAWNTEASAKSYVPWGTALHDNMNQSAHYGITRAEPEYVSWIPRSPSGGCLLSDGTTDEVAPPPLLSARGGCDCRMLRSPTPQPNWLTAPLLMLLGLLAAMRRCWGTSNGSSTH